MIREILTDLITYIINFLLPSEGLDEIEQKERSTYICSVSLIFWAFMICMWINSKNCSNEEDEENGDPDEKDENNNENNDVEVLPVVNNEKLVEFSKFTQDLNISFLKYQNLVILTHMKGNMMFEPVRNDNVTEYYLKHCSPNSGYMVNSNYEPVTFISNKNNKVKRFILIE